MTDTIATRGTALVAEDDTAARQLMVELCRSAGYATVAAADGHEALAAGLRAPPRLAVLDVNLPGLSGYEVCRGLREAYGDRVGILFVSGERTESFDRVAGLLVGADDYVVKPYAPDELLARLRALGRRIARAPDALPASHGLTPRELEVLVLLAEGLDQREIAARLVISPKTVATHLEHVLQKLQVKSRAQAVALAYRAGLLDATPA